MSNVIISIGKRIVPRPVRRWVARSVLGLGTASHWTGRYRCPVCRSRLRFFEALPPHFREELERYENVNRYDEPETLNAEHYLCPVCYSTDRDRLFCIFFAQVFKRLDRRRKYTFLDFAPGDAIAVYFRSLPFLEYRTADLLVDNVDDRHVDIEDMTLYADDQFDFFICSHVLEHVKNPGKALAELYRVLKPGGRGVLLVPILIGVETTMEDAAHATPEERWKFYGQDDHLRLFGRSDFMSRIRKAGFELRTFHASTIGARSLRRYGISETSVLYTVTKS